jgi:peptide deformylase
MSRPCLTVLEYPDPRLRIAAAPVHQFDSALHQLVEDMLQTIHATRSIGLAATQVGVPLRVMVVDVSPDQNAPMCLVNPEVGARQMPGMVEEQCLSVPGFAGNVARHLRIHVRAQDRHGVPFELDAEGLLAVCVQHELDHLEGKLFIDRLPWLTRMLAKRKLASPRAATARQDVSPGQP